MAMCGVESESEECIDDRYLNASKDRKESCIVASNHVLPGAMCEHTSNFYWNYILPRKNLNSAISP